MTSSRCLDWRSWQASARCHRISGAAGTAGWTALALIRGASFPLCPRFQPAAGVGHEGGVPAEVPAASAGHLRHSHPGATRAAAPPAVPEEIRVRQGGRLNSDVFLFCTTNCVLLTTSAADGHGVRRLLWPCMPAVAGRVALLRSSLRSAAVTQPDVFVCPRRDLIRSARSRRVCLRELGRRERPCASRSRRWAL